MRTAVIVWAWLACGPAPDPAVPIPPPNLPPTAKVETWRQMAEDRLAQRHPSDGAGRLDLVEGPAEVGVGTPGTWTVAFTVGPDGIAEGGSLTFHAPPFWGWSDPQVHRRDAPGHTTVAPLDGVSWTLSGLGNGMLLIQPTGRGLRPGEVVRVTYGDGPAGAIADRFAERGQGFRISVDGDGDGLRGLVPGVAEVQTKAGPVARLHVTLPSVAKPGTQPTLRIAALDGAGNRTDASAEVLLRGPSSLNLPETVRLRDGVATLALSPPSEGVIRVVAGTPGAAPARSNPMLVRDAQPVLWADLQVHTGLSDGTGDLEDVTRYARDVAGLDVVAVTDHDRWGQPFLVDSPEAWSEVQAVADRFTQDGFVAVPAYEWTNWLFGHRHVLYLDRVGPIYSAMNPDTDTPAELWEALAAHPGARTIAHHSAGGPVAVDWRSAPPPGLEPTTEIVSVHGSSESADTPGRIYGFVPGNTVRDALARGYRLGFLGSTDGHDGHPGLSQLAGASGGLTALVTADRSRTGVREALDARATYATNGHRPLLRFSVSDVPMGGELNPTASATVSVRYIGESAVRTLELIRSGQTVEQGPAGQEALFHTWTVSDLVDGETLYVRITEVDGGVAWSSPVFVSAD